MTSPPCPNKQSPVAPREVVIGIDLSRHRTTIGLFDRNLKPICFETLPTLMGSPEVVVQSALIGAKEVLGRVSQCRLRSVGVGVAGDVDPISNVVRHAGDLSVGGSVDLGRLIEAALDVPAHVESEVNVGALGAQLVFNPVKHLAYVNIGSETAVGSVRDGVLERGLVEHSVTGSANKLRDLPATGGFSPAQTAGRTCAKAREEILEQAASFLQLVGLAYDAEVITVGGEAIAGGQPFTDQLRTTMIRREAASAELSDIGLSTRFRALPIDYTSVLGAALLASDDGCGRVRPTVAGTLRRSDRFRRCR